MTNKITVDKSVLLYVMEQAIVKGISMGKKNNVDMSVEEAVSSLSKQFTNDVDRYSLAKPRG